MSIYQHFRPEEKEFIDQVLNWQSFVKDNYAPRLSDFLDPREQFIVQSIIGGENDCKVSFFGGNEHAERKRAFLYPEYIEPSQEDFQCTLFEIEYPDKFIHLTHPQILGSLMGLGLRRGKFGDILLDEKRIQFLAASEVTDYIKLHFHTVGKTTIALAEKSLDDLIGSQEEYQEIQATVSSMRLDTILASITKISRQKAVSLIQSGTVKVNWRLVEQPSFVVQQGDLISARGYGRIKILLIGDQTKKEKWRITVGKLK
ncbi:RNA-binding protein [Caldibacillus lycopersici]|uniref:RNA-binding protein n=1 Tax=Perspicuibacillus lycopersici TaxID=1325689 RepID=A0AAE3IQ71_9BACI|nr:RNA-binding protein [Perspicuibacillus lycopersici]MCU9612182.1 RNA-binding protein [Perspicuibacillus lycopersici]